MDKQPVKISSRQRMPEAEDLAIIDCAMFTALQNIHIDEMDSKRILPVLPFLAKLLLDPAFIKRQQLFKLLYPIKKMNDVIELLTLRPSEIFDTVNQTLPISSFESSSPADKLKIVAMEYLRIQEIVRQLGATQYTASKCLESDLFDNQLYVGDIAYCLSALLLSTINIPSINMLDMCEALIHFKLGFKYIIRLVANMPDRCQEVCQTLITFGDRLDESVSINEVAEQRFTTLKSLCLMNPSIAFTIRTFTLQVCKIPSLTVMITIENLKEALSKYSIAFGEEDSVDSSDMKMEVDCPVDKDSTLKDLEDSFDNAIAFITGILLGVDEATRQWFAHYIRTSQQNPDSILSVFRSIILACMNRIFPWLHDDNYFESESPDGNGTPNESINPKSKPTQRDINRKLIRATATLKFYCAMKCTGALKLSSDEYVSLSHLITCKPPVSQISVNFATTGVCSILACPSIINSQKDERRTAKWLKWLIKDSNYSDNRFLSHGKCSISELLLLIAIHFQNNQNNQIADLVCATLDMKLRINYAVSECKSLFVQDVFNEQMVAEHAIKVPVTKNLNNNITEFLPVHCIHQLLVSRTFSKHQVPIKDWIYRQICESKRPIHNVLPKLIEAYVHSVIVSFSTNGRISTNEPISEEEVARVFQVKLYSVDADTNHTILTGPSKSRANNANKNDRKRFKRETTVGQAKNDENKNDNDQMPEIVDVYAAQVLILYYLTMYEDLKPKENGNNITLERSKLIKYSADIMMEIPVFFLLQMVRENQSSFSAILPDLLKLVASQYPQLCSVQHWFTFDNCRPLDSGSIPESVKSDQLQEIFAGKLKGKTAPKSPVRTNKLSLTNSISHPLKVLKTEKDNLLRDLRRGFERVDSDCSSLIKTIGLVSILPKEEIWSFVNIFIESLPRIMSLEASDEPEYKKLIQVTSKLWWRFNVVFPRKLWVMTVNALKRHQHYRNQDNDIKPVEYSWDELTADPLIVLRCDIRVFRCEATLNIVLHILNAFLAASGRCLQDQIRSKDIRAFEELKNTLMLAQTSAAIQILLENCLPTDEEEVAMKKKSSSKELSPSETLLLERLDASINCICGHLHQVFIADTNLAKLVHFQTYPSELLFITSNKIPSMHICLDFIPELLSQPDLSKQVFVIELTSYLCEKYAITKSLNVAKLCFNVANTLLQLLPSERRALFFIPVLPALIRICNVFPILREDADIILNQINEITLAHIAATSSRLSLGSSKPFEDLERLDWPDIERLMSTLNMDEALYLCIKKCSRDLSLSKQNDSSVSSVKQPVELAATPRYNSIFAYGNHVLNPTT